MRSNGRQRAPRRVVALVAAVAIVPLAVFLWLGARLLDQDRQLEQQQARDRLQTAADLVAATLQRAIASSEQWLAAGADDWPDGAVALTFSTDGIVAVPRGRLAYLPVLPPLRSVPPEPFQAAEALEFQKHDRQGAIAAYRVLALSSDHAVRTGALMRLARNLDVAGRSGEALATYAALQRTADVAEAGVVVGLSAAWARCAIFERLGRDPELKAAATALREDLEAGRWPALESTYVTYAADATRWAGRPVSIPRGEIFSAAVSTLWKERSGPSPHETSQWRRRSMTVHDESLAVIWQSAGTTTRALIAATPFIESEWLRPVAAVAAAQSVAVELRDGSRRAIPSPAPDFRRRSVAVAAPVDGERCVRQSAVEPGYRQCIDRGQRRIHRTAPSADGRIRAAGAPGGSCQLVDRSSGDTRGRRGAASVRLRRGGVPRIPYAAHGVATIHRYVARAAGARP